MYSNKTKTDYEIKTDISALESKIERIKNMAQTEGRRLSGSEKSLI